MGLLDSLTGGLLDKFGSGSTHPGLAGEVIDMLGGSQGGGLAGLTRAFEGNGLGHVIQSWISTGQNLPISAEQIQQVLGSAKVQELAARFGIDESAVASQLATLLPQVVNGVTPQGQVPEPGLLQEGLSLLRSRLG